MRTIVTATSRNFMASRLRQRDVIIAGATYATVRFSMEQVAGQVAQQVGPDVLSVLNHSPLDCLALVDTFLGGLAVMVGLGDGMPTGSFGTAVLLILPVGGPVWAGVVPLGATFRSLRNVSRLVGRLGARVMGKAHLGPAVAGPWFGGTGALDTSLLLLSMRTGVGSEKVGPWP